jgi:hypothetical protein
MESRELNRYFSLNQLAGKGGTVILGGTEDRNIPLCELKQAFELEDDLYNRSVTGVSVEQAVEVYDACVAPLSPDTVLLHIGEADLPLFEKNAAAFDDAYRRLIAHIRSFNKKCRVVVITLRNPTKAPLVAEMNRHLKYLAESERCDYSDISGRMVWNPVETKEVFSFVNTIGLTGALRNKRPIYDLIKILFCCEPAFAS